MKRTLTNRSTFGATASMLRKLMDTRSAVGRRFPARAKYRTYYGKALLPRDYFVDVVWETPTSFKIRAIEKTPLPGVARFLEPGKTELVSKRSIIFI